VPPEPGLWRHAPASLAVDGALPKPTLASEPPLLGPAKPRRLDEPTAVYGTIENIVAREDAGIRAYVPLPAMNHRQPFSGQDAFVYEAAEARYRCPEGHILVRERTNRTRAALSPLRVMIHPAGDRGAGELDRNDDAADRRLFPRAVLLVDVGQTSIPESKTAPDHGMLLATSGG